MTPGGAVVLQVIEFGDAFDAIAHARVGSHGLNTPTADVDLNSPISEPGDVLCPGPGWHSLAS